MADDTSLSFAAVIDSSNFDNGIAHIEEKVSEVGDKTQSETSRISEILKNVPTLNIDVVSNASRTLADIDQAYAEIDRVADANKAALKELEAEYNRVGALAAAAYKKATVEGDKEYAQLNEQQKAIKSLINERKRVISSVEEEADKVMALENRMKEEAKATQDTANQHKSLRQQIRELKQEMADAVANGIDQQSEAYKKLVNRLGELTDLQGDIQQQGNVLANDEAKIAGVINGLSGLSGAFSAAQGAVAMFAGENEELNKIMLKVQSLMAITMGLQQVQQTLNKDSAFSLVTLNSLKQWWNKLLEVGRGEQVAETAATLANTAAQAANTAATVADTTAQEANNTATAQGTVANAANTAGQVVNTGAAVAGTAANIGLAGAFRMVGAAIKSIPVFGWIAAAIGVLIGVISHFISKAKEADEEVEEQNKITEDARKSYAQASATMESYRQRIETFNGTKKQESKLVAELNDKYGSALGKYSSLSKWKSVLTTKGAAYCNMLLKEAEAQAFLNKYTEAFVALQDATALNKQYKQKSWIAKIFSSSHESDMADAKSQMDRYLQLYKKTFAEAEDLKSNFNLNPVTPSSSSSTSTGGSGSADTFDPKEAALTQKEAIEEMKNDIIKWRKDAQSQVDDAVVENMANSQAKEINQIVLDTEKKKSALRQSLSDLANSMKENYKKVFMAQKNATEEGWAKSNRGKMSTEDYMKELLSDPQNYKLYNKRLEDIVEQGERQKQDIRDKYYNEWVEKYGNTQQKIEQLEKQYQQTLAAAPQAFVPQIVASFEKQFAELKNTGFKESIDWDSVFGDLGKQSLSTLQYTLSKVRSYFEQNKKEMGTEDIKNYTEAITKMENEIASRNPFTAFHRSLENIKSSKNDFTEALKEWKKAQDDLTTAQQEYNKALTEKEKLQKRLDLSNNIKSFAKQSASSIDDMIIMLQERLQKKGSLDAYEKSLLNSLQVMKKKVAANDPFQQLTESLAKINQTQLTDANGNATAGANALRQPLQNAISDIYDIQTLLKACFTEAKTDGADFTTQMGDALGNLQVLLGIAQQGISTNSDEANNALKLADDRLQQLGATIAVLRQGNNGQIVDEQTLLQLLTNVQDFMDTSIAQNGEYADNYKQSVDDLTDAQNNLNKAQDDNNKAENKTLQSRNKITVSYKEFSNQIRNIGSVIDKVGGQAKNLASIFDDDVADSIDKAIDTVTSLLNAASTVVDTLGETSKSVVSNVSTTAQATAGAMKATATTAAASIATVEKASVILAVISAALQVATAIANLFNNDNKKQKEIEHLQQRIDQLQWELDNEDAVRLQERYGDAVKNVCNIYLQTYNEVLNLNNATLKSGNIIERIRARIISQNEAYSKSIQKIADAYANVSYTADKALGADKYNDARKQLENYAEQQILLQKQIDKERDKKKTDQTKIADWQQKIQENAEKMASVINDMVEDIVGGSAEDIAKQLGDAFYDAAAQGKDALEGWHDKVKDIVADITKRMMISKLLEEPIGKIFDQYKKKWFGDDGRFKGIDAVVSSMAGLATDLNEVGENFQNLYNSLPENIKNMMGGSEADREGVSKGIATASQESVDENNARLTTIQGHTYNLVQGMETLNQTGNAMLEHLTSIDKNTQSTNDKLDRMNTNMRNIRETVDDIYLKGVNIKK